MKIFLITADYRNPPKTYPYPVRARNKKEAREYFNQKFSWLKIYKIEEYTGDEADIKYFY